MPGANPHSAEPAANTTSPARSFRSAPIRSPSPPADSSSPANTTVYASTTRCSPETEAENCRPGEGGATFTIVASTITMNQPKQTAATGRGSKRVLTDVAGHNHLRAADARVRSRQPGVSGVER